MDEHGLIVAVKELALELGVTPTRGQFEMHVKGAINALRKINGGYSKLLTMAGLAPYSERRITNAIFEKNIDSHIQTYVPKDNVERPPYPTIATISDIHWPFSNKKVLATFQEFVGDVKPEWVILNGDAWDMYSHSKFARSHNVFTPREEQNSARESNEKFWQGILKGSPKSKCIQMLGNHDIRPMRRALESYPEAEDWIAEKMKDLFTFEGVRTVYDYREELEIGDIRVFHGYRSGLGDHRDFTLYNCINGHTHLGGSVFRHLRGQTLWELNSGLAGDPESKGLTYTPQKITKWTPGFGSVDKIGPRFHPC